MTTPAPRRPRVVLVTTASIDGRISLSAAERLLDPEVYARWTSGWPADVEPLLEQRRQWIEDRHAPTVTMEGSGTFVAADATSPWTGRVDADDVDDVDDAADLLRDHLPRRAPRWFAVVDGRGRVDWTHTGDDETALLVLVCRATPTGYLRHLRELGVGYLVVGEDHVDLALALERMGDVLGARTVVTEGGGGINGALVRADLVEELHVVTVPVLVGGLGTPTFVDGAPLPPGGTPIELHPTGLTQGAHGSTWARYEVRRPATPDAGPTSVTA